MSEETTTASAAQGPDFERNKKRSRRNFLMIVAVAVLPVMAAYIMFFTGIGVPGNTVNKGELLGQPISMEALLPDDVWQTISADKKWRVFLPVDATCNARCEENFYTTRQVHIRLGEKSARVERYALNLDGAAGEAYLAGIAEDHPQLKTASVDGAQWREWSAPLAVYKEDRDNHFYLLVDQEGFAMMVYTDQHGNDLLKDLKRALKYSIDFQN